MTSVVIPGIRDERIFCLDVPIEAQAYVNVTQFGITVDALNAIERQRKRHLKKQDLAETRCFICALFCCCCCCCLGTIPFCCAVKRHDKAAKRMIVKYYEVLAEHNEKYYNPTGVNLKVNNNTTVASGTGYVNGATTFVNASSTKWYLTIEISARPTSAAVAPEESAVISLRLMTKPPKEVSIRIADDATFNDLLEDARATFHLDKSIHMQAVDSKNVVYSGRVNVLAALAKNKNTHVYITVDM